MTIQRTFNRTLETTFVGLISGEREIPVSSVTNLSGNPANDVNHDAIVRTHNALCDLQVEHRKHTEGLAKMIRGQILVDWVDNEDEEKFVEFDGEFLFPASGRLEWTFYVKENNIDSLFSNLPTEVIVDGDALSIEWVKEETTYE